MVKKSLLVLIMVVFAVGGAFAQNSFSSMAKNTITIDVGPTIVGFAIAPAINMVGVEGLSGSGKGVAGQYERQLSGLLSVAGRFAYLSTDLELLVKEARDAAPGVTVDVNAKTDMNLTSFSGEGHIRFYPLGDTFFLDGMVGYAQLKTVFKGKIDVNSAYGSGTKTIDFDASRDYLKLGAKLGWRISFGKNGGFTFEPSVGYSYGIGMGDTFQEKLKKELGGDAPDVNDIIPLIENYVFIGGPRVSLAFGYRF